MDRQAIFNTVVMHLLHQNAPSIDGEGRCRYRGDRGRKCAVGVLIPDDLYNPLMEGKGVSGLVAGWPEFVDILQLDEASCKLLRSLQAVHDDNDPGGWSEALARVAERYDLRMPGGIA